MESCSIVTRSPPDMKFCSKQNQGTGDVASGEDKTCSKSTTEGSGQVSSVTSEDPEDDLGVMAFHDVTIDHDTPASTVGHGESINHTLGPLSPRNSPVKTHSHSSDTSQHSSSFYSPFLTSQNSALHPEKRFEPSPMRLDASEVAPATDLRYSDKSETGVDVERDRQMKIDGLSRSDNSFDVKNSSSFSSKELQSCNDHNDNRVDDDPSENTCRRPDIQNVPTGFGMATSFLGNENDGDGEIDDDDDDDLDNSLVVNMDVAESDSPHNSQQEQPQQQPQDNRYQNQSPEKTSVTLSVPKPIPSTTSGGFFISTSTPHEQQKHQQQQISEPKSSSSSASSFSLSSVATSIASNDQQQIPSSSTPPPSLLTSSTMTPISSGLSSSLSTSKCPPSIFSPPMSPPSSTSSTTSSSNRSPSMAVSTSSKPDSWQPQSVVSTMIHQESKPSLSPETHVTQCTSAEKVNTKQDLGLRPTSGSKSLPIHCVIEQSPASCAGQHQNHASSLSSQPIVMLDSYAILPGATPFCDVVSASLSKLGYSSAEAREATGGIQLKNWKTLPLQAVTDRREAIIEEMLGELTSVATLRVQLNSGKRVGPGSDEVKEKLLQLLLTQSKDVLLQAGCPIEKSQLDALSAGEITQGFSDSMCSAFHNWYIHQVEPATRSDTAATTVSPSKPHSTDTSGTTFGHQQPLLVTPSKPLFSSLTVKKESSSQSKGEERSSPSEQRSQERCSQLGNIPTTASSYTKHGSGFNNRHIFSRGDGKLLENGPVKEDGVHRNTKLDHQSTSSLGRISASTRDAVVNHSLQSSLHYPRHSLMPQVTGAAVSNGGIGSSLPTHIPSMNTNGSGNNSAPFLGLMPGKTRIRTSFDPEHEIPRLHKWFSHNQHPTREQMLRYMHELNSLESRRGRRPLDLTNIIYWFKNARAAQRRACKALDDPIDDPAGAGEEGRSADDSNGHSQLRESMTDNCEAEDNGVGSGSLSLDGSQVPGNPDGSLPPYLPNKNAVYMIPFHPYLQTSPSGHARLSSPLPGMSVASSGEDQPYDLSLAKRRPSVELSPPPHKRQAREAIASQDEDEKSESQRSHDHGSKKNEFSSSNSASISKSDIEHRTDKSNSDSTAIPFYLPSSSVSSSSLFPPRFPALLDVASKIRQDIPAGSGEDRNSTTLTLPNPKHRMTDKTSAEVSGNVEPMSNGLELYKNLDNRDSRLGKIDKAGNDNSQIDHVGKVDLKEQDANNEVNSARSKSLHNGTVLPSHLYGVNINEEAERDPATTRDEKAGFSPRSRQSSNSASHSNASHSPDSGLELGQIHKDDGHPSSHVKHTSSDEEDIDNEDNNLYRQDNKESFGDRTRRGSNSHIDNDSGEEMDYQGRHRGSNFQNHRHHPEHPIMDSMDLDSETELLKLRLKQSKDYADYASAAAMHSNVSRLTAANMAALSLAQMGGLHLPQLPPSLAMAYYPMDPRFYSAVPPPPHPTSPTPLTRSSAVTPSSSPSTISPHLHSHLHPHHADSRSPLPSPSAVGVNQGIPQLNHLQPHPHQHQSLSPSPQHQRGPMNSSEPRKRRTRVFIDPLTEIPKLEKWFLEDTHPSAFMIDKFCEELNTCEYRHKFPKLEPKNVQLWFKNHRAKVKRMKTVSTSDGSIGGGEHGRDDMDDDLDD